MKRLVILFFAFLSTNAWAQTSRSPTPLSLGFYAPFATQPGVKLGIQYPWLQTSGLFKKLNGSSTQRIRNTFINPEIAYFTRINSNDNLLINADIGYKVLRTRKNYYSEYSIGLGYLVSWETLSVSVNLGSGDISDRDIERRSFFLPTINYTIGKHVDRGIGWFSKASFGREISSREDAGFFALEIGITYNIK